MCAQLSSVLGGPRTPTAHLLDPHLTGSSPAFSSTLTISLRQFEACACTPAPRAYPHPLHNYARKTGPATPPLHSWRNRSGKVEALLRRLAILGSGACCRGPAPGQRPKLYSSRSKAVRSSALISCELGEAEALTPEPSLRLAEVSLFGANSMETVSIATYPICVNIA